MRRFLFEAPVDTGFYGDNDDDIRANLLKSANKSYKEKKSQNNISFQQLMPMLSNKEREYYDELLEIGKKLFLYDFPDIKRDVDDGSVILDINFIRSQNDYNTLRTVSQTVNQQKLVNAKEKDPQFEERLKSRNFNNSLTQGFSWEKGFNDYKRVENLIRNINPDLINYYNQFEVGANVFYHENENMMQSMANSSSGRVAWMDVVDGPNDTKKIIVRAPNFPLLLHELTKAGNYFNSLRFVPEDTEIFEPIKYTTDTHKNEIKNMRYGQPIVRIIKYIWKNFITDYEEWMDGAINNQYFNYSNQAPSEYNAMMRGISTKDLVDEYEDELKKQSNLSPAEIAKMKEIIKNYHISLRQFIDITNIIVSGIKKQYGESQKNIDVSKIEPKTTKPIEPEYDDEEYDDDDEEPNDDDDMSWMDDIENEDED